MTPSTEQRLLILIREKLGDDEGLGLGPVTGPHADQVGEPFADHPAQKPARNKQDLERALDDTLMRSAAFSRLIDGFTRSVQQLLKREVGGKVPGLTPADIDFSLHVDGDFEISLSHGITSEVVRAVLEGLPPAR